MMKLETIAMKKGKAMKIVDIDLESLDREEYRHLLGCLCNYYYVMFSQEVYMNYEGEEE